MPDAHRTIRSLGIERAGEANYTEYREGPAAEGEVRIDLAFTGFSAGTELTFLKATNPYLSARWDETDGVFIPGEPSASFPVPFLGYMEVGRVIDARAPGFAKGDFVATTFGHKSGHTANPSRDLMLTLPPALDPILGVLVAQMGPICANGILHADAEAFGAAVPRLGAGIEGRPVVVWGGGTVGLLTALFARNAGAEVLIAEPSAWRRGIAGNLGFEALPEEEACQHAKAFWPGSFGRGAEFVFQTRARSESLHLALRALRPQGTVIDLAFYQGGLDRTRLGEEFHHNGLAIRCAQINRVPRPLAAAWDRRRLAQETLALLAKEGDAIRRHLITHVVPFDEGAEFLRHLLRDRPEFLQIVFEAA